MKNAAGRKHAERGTALIVVIITVAVFVVIAGALHTAFRGHLRVTEVNKGRLQALYIADAGIEDGRQYLYDNPSWDTGFDLTWFGAGNHSLAVITTADSLTLSDTGRAPALKSAIAYDTVLRNVTAELIFIDSPYVLLTSSGDLEIGKDAGVISGSCYSSAGLTLKDDNTVTGNLEALGDIVNDAGATVTGSLNGANYLPLPDAIVFPAVDAAAYKTEAIAGSTISGNLTLNNKTQNLGPVYITGNLTIRANSVITLVGTVYVEGNIEINKSALYGAQVIYSAGDYNIHTSAEIGTASAGPLMTGAGNFEIIESDINHAFAYFPASNVTFNKGCDLNGTFIGSQLTVDDNPAQPINISAHSATTPTLPIDLGDARTLSFLSWGIE